jgi:ABC-type phosphate transport system substrate-binding protein
MRRILATIAALSFLALAGGTAAGAGSVPPFPHLPGAWSHAEINVTIKRTPHTLILDRGRIVQASSAQLTLREADGSLVVVPLAESTIVVLYNRPAAVLDLRKRMSAQTMRIDGGAAVRVRATF